ncbi:hypothetical protein TCAL_08558 [Tigriopus californicus]|uniref:C-type lectin domain-containing protein n=2 Tax=Tigriopus californicus TaxID=6832 RepID=A0A553PHH0_TIGCA|nr:hypothetical protein TCAL_08558 [Tigriopus californicus]|eukprot:TCALIF_08558-PA protein Name:"Protein of unknown function" AED:0.32 eAED:0.32 QI:0/0.5/0/0.66/0.5/0.33/3/0/201
MGFLELWLMVFVMGSTGIEDGFVEMANGKYYKVFDSTNGYHDAKAFCEGLGHQYFLAVIQHVQDFEAVSRMVQDADVYQIWVGIRNQQQGQDCQNDDCTKQLVWDIGSISCPFVWKEFNSDLDIRFGSRGHPCARVIKEPKKIRIDDSDCTNTFGSICEYVPSGLDVAGSICQSPSDNIPNASNDLAETSGRKYNLGCSAR